MGADQGGCCGCWWRLRVPRTRDTTDRSYDRARYGRIVRQCVFRVVPEEGDGDAVWGRHRTDAQGYVYVYVYVYVFVFVSDVKFLTSHPLMPPLAEQPVDPVALCGD